MYLFRVFFQCVFPQNTLSPSLHSVQPNVSGSSHLTFIFQSGAVYCASVADCSAGGLPQEGNPGIYKALPSPLLPLTPSLSWREDIGPPESGHDALAANEIESEGVWGDSSRKPRRRRRRPKSKQSSSRSSRKRFTLSPEFVAKYISSPTPHTPIWDVSDPWCAYNDHQRETHSDLRRRTKSELWRTPVGP